MPEYKFAHVHIISADPVKTAEFYEQNLGAQREAVRKTSDGCTNVDLDLGGTRLQIREPRPKALLPADCSPNGGGLEHIGLYTDDFEASINALKANGVQFVQEVRQLSTHKVTFFLAPEKVLVELMSAK